MFSTTFRALQGRSPLRFLLFLAATLVAAPGCGGSKGAKNSVSGAVTLNGKQVAGTVTFIGADSKEATGPIGPDGKYTIDDPPTGQVKITVKGFLGVVPGTGAPAPPKDTGAVKDAAPLSGTPTGMGVAPPTKYAMPENGLTFNVTGGRQTHDIVLTP